MPYQDGQTATGPNGEKIVFHGGAWQPVAAPAQAGPPAFIPGVPKAAPPPKPFEPPSGYQGTPDHLAPIPGGPADKPVKSAEQTAAERKAAGFVIRAQGANDNFGKVQKIGGRSLVGQYVADTHPNVANEMASPDRQLSDNAQREFIASVLRLDSGAAIPPEELVTNQRIYFPQPGDGPEVLKQKEGARWRAINSLRIQAGQPELPMPEDREVKSGRTGKSYSFTVPEGADDAAILAAAKAALMAQEPNTTEPPIIDPEGGGGGSPPSADSNFDPGTDGLGNLAAQGFTLGLSDELNGIGEAIAAFANDGRPLSAYTRGRDEERARLDAAREASPVLGKVAEYGSGMMVGGPVFKGASSVLNAAKSGAAMGAATGFGYGDGAGGSAVNALAGAGMGGAAGAGMAAAAPYVGNALAKVLPNRKPPTAINREVINAGTRREVPVRGPDANPDMRLRRSELRTSPRVGQQIRDAEVDDIKAMEGAVTRDLGGGSGPNRSRVGEVAQEGVGKVRDTMRNKASTHYTRAHKLAGNTRIEARDAVAAIDQNIAELTAAGPEANDKLITYLGKVRRDLSREGGLSVEALRNQRTNLRGQLKAENLDATDAERRMGMVLDGAAQDINRGLSGKPHALSEFRKGDQLWRERSQFTKQIGQKLLGRNKDNPASAESAAATIEGWAAKDANRFRRLWAELDPAERAEWQGHMADSLGRNAKGEFSLEYFLKHTGNGKGAIVSDKAARMVFGDEGMAAIKDLRILAQAKVDAGSATNRSETGTVANRLFTGLRHMLLTGLGFGVGDFSGAVAAPVAGAIITRMGEARATRLMLNPNFTKWLRQTPNTANPKAIDAHFARLSKIPSIAANDNAALMKAVRETFSASPGRVSATTEQKDDRRVKPPQ